MNAKEIKVKQAAEKLVNKFLELEDSKIYGANLMFLSDAKECAKIAVRAIYDYFIDKL